MKVAESGIWGSCHFPAILREGPGPTPSSWLSVAQCSTQVAASLLRTCREGQRTCISSQQTTDGGDARRLDSATAPDFCGVFSNVLPRNPLPIVHVDTTQRKIGGWICEHDAMRTDDLHCGSCSASTQFSIHSLPPLWPKAPHGPNSQAT